MIGPGAPTGIVLDIEGTIGPITYVRDTLFPYARDRILSVLCEPPGADRDDVHQVVADVRDHLATPDADLTQVAAELRRMTDADLKFPALKSLQGIIWRDGYGSGELKAPVYEDVPPALRRWRNAGRQVFVYSSGSELAQRLWFGHTDHGDLTDLITHFFDTVSAGPKTVPDSYTRIAALTGHSPEALTFVSDSREELRAANDAGWSAVAVRRKGATAAQQQWYWEQMIDRFDDLPF